MSSGVELFSYDSKLANKNPIDKELVIAGLACSPLINPLSPKSDQHQFSPLILLHEKFMQFDWLRAVVFQLNLKYLHVKITKPLWVVV